MSLHRDRLLGRRAFLGLVPLSLGGAWLGRQHALGANQMEFEGDCADEPAADMLLRFARADFLSLPYMGLEASNVTGPWMPVNSPELGPFLIPEGWSSANAWANTFDDDGIPEWQGEPLNYPFWSTTLVVSPDQSAVYMHVRGGVDNVYLMPGDAADVARRTMLGAGTRSRPVCSVGQVAPDFDMTTVDWVSADRHRNDLLLVRGWAIQAEFGGPSLGPGTTFGFDAMMAPRRDAADYMVNVFLRILWQFVPRGAGGSSTPTPTPTPGF